eukprot:c23886_g1_i1 orf=47-1552(-)
MGDPTALQHEMEQTLLSEEAPKPCEPRKQAQRLFFYSCTFLALAIASLTVVASSALAFSSFTCQRSSILRSYNSPSSSAQISTEEVLIPATTSTEEAPVWGSAKKLKTLEKPVVLLISLDGFRYGYQWKVPLPAIDRLRTNGSEAIPGMYPVYPTLTFPNHYSIATGLYPAWHGIIANKFSDPTTGGKFKPGVVDPKWWLGEPMWETVVKNGLVAATVFWPGSDVTKGPWNCTLPYCHSYNSSVPYEERVDAVLGYFDLPDDERPSFISLYFEEPDHTGHIVGPDDPHMDAAITFVDQMLGSLFDGLDERGIFDDVSIILVSDHGMVGTCDTKVIYLDDFAPWVNISGEWVDTLTPLFTLWPPSELDVEEVYQNMTDALNSGEVENSEFFKVYLKEDFPARFLYSSSERVEPIIGIVAEGYKLDWSRSSIKQCGGAHGYDNELLSMRPIFVAHGPQFAKGRKLPTFVNVEIYNLIATILGIEAAPNNGTASFPDSVLLPVG